MRSPRAISGTWGNRRTTKEGSSDMKFQNLCLPKNRSWPRFNSATGQYRTIDEPLLHCERNSAAAVLGRDKDQNDDDYEDPELHMVEAWQPIKILPARPIKESEYADTRYFKSAMDTPLSLDTKTSVPMEHHHWHTQMGLGKVDEPISKDSRNQHVKGDRPTKGSKTPLPPPRPPVTLPKKYQPLPPQPESSWSPPPQRLSFPEVQKGPRQISLKDLSEVLGTERVPHYQMKPESIHLSQTQSIPEIPLVTASSPFMMRNHSVQNRDHKESMQFHPQRCQSPARYSPQENLLHYKNTSWRKPSPTSSDEKDVQNNDWYIGEHSRQAVEEALRKENKDGTFLVRDCSTKSRAEPYVLVVFYGNKVYNVKIRFLEKNQQFALGTGLRGDEKFNSVEDIIEHYKYFPIILIDGKDKTGIHKEQCYLTQPLPLSRCFSPW
ncbi:cytokine-dependent hematopoietic cell linker isoform X2 [Canis lupus familiaris]|uniref:cytokine-dependent hematopoietic cell linker isoform X2 n=1 Tax=Canis lupus familiaris TaxID=9615 RepID=UPI000BAA034D|nr:cytokine-dependent hematopoietic cell linker isoform X2 [Canis lupus familiaris]XP_035570478.1 cytokine-dependent hematopoietic cell linker isoform X1 [Canis lupus dingo]XP_038389307.1 cytokine-dependent hematopoietic cell linker isoform X2 [Canis lupus familiaris]XP_038517801.1 cytokine-dependent hematopoietic cell linker isoform X2 [Canis lupus familiaris]|eukprot:XP_022272887.1 cytokine-dependent hematopoietic cell linker isoform X1 [Canis lupus familiaris]